MKMHSLESLAQTVVTVPQTMGSKTFLLDLFVILLIFFCEFPVKTTEHTVASYESSDFT
jgi:hypothetical protein